MVGCGYTHCQHPKPRCSKCNYRFVENRHDICENCQPETACTVCGELVDRAMRNERDGVMVCFDCLTDYTPSKQRICANLDCRENFVPTKTGQEYCDKCEKELRICKVFNCGTTFIPHFIGDDKCLTHASRCISCGTKSNGAFCVSCEDLISNSTCTHCREPLQDGICDDTGKCVDCMDAAMGDFQDNHTYCRCGVNKTTVEGDICSTCPIYNTETTPPRADTLCPNCRKIHIKKTDLMCTKCLQEKLYKYDKKR